MAAQSNFKNMTLCLLVICLVCSALLSIVYAVTKSPIEAAAAAKTNNAIAQVVPAFDGDPVEGVVEVDGVPCSYYAVSRDTCIVGYAIKCSSVGFGGPLDLMVGITSDGVIYNTSVLSCNETPGLGAKCVECEGTFRTQFAGFNPSERKLEVKKDGGDVDAITASTITSRAFCKAVQQAVAAYRLIAPEPVCEAADSLAVENSTEGE